jgi:hypothetical protein
LVSFDLFIILIFKLFNRYEYFETYPYKHLGSWITSKSLDSTNNLIERFNQFVKYTIFQRKTYNNTAVVVDHLGKYFGILEATLLGIESPELEEKDEEFDLTVEQVLNSSTSYLLAQDGSIPDTLNLLMENDLSIALGKKLKGDKYKRKRRESKQSNSATAAKEFLSPPHNDYDCSVPDELIVNDDLDEFLEEVDNLIGGASNTSLPSSSALPPPVPISTPSSSSSSSEKIQLSPPRRKRARPETTIPVEGSEGWSESRKLKWMIDNALTALSK